MVAAATHSMCEAANTMVQGSASEEKLIASAKEVAGSTAALLVACRVKADPGSKAMQRLQVGWDKLYLCFLGKCIARFSKRHKTKIIKQILLWVVINKWVVCCNLIENLRGG